MYNLNENKKRSKLSKSNTWGSFSASRTWSTRPQDWTGPTGTSSEPTRTSSGDCQETESRMVRATTASPKSSFSAPWRVGDAVPGRENARWTTWKSGHPCPCQNCSQGLPAEKTESWSLLYHPSYPPPHPTPDDPVGQGTELNSMNSSWPALFNSCW